MAEAFKLVGDGRAYWPVPRVDVDLVYNPNTGRWEGLPHLRAERDGGGEGRKYSIRCIAMDASGNATYATVCVTVPKNLGRNR